MSGSRPEAFTLGDDALEMELWRDPTYTPGSVDNVHRYGREIVRRAALRRGMSRHRGRPGGAARRHALRGLRDHVAALGLPSLHVE